MSSGGGDHFEKIVETWVTAPKRPSPKGNQQACLVHIYPTGATIGTRYPLTDQPVILGRGDDCDIRTTDHSVSRHHLRIEPGPEGYEAFDLQSTNGTFVNNVATVAKVLKDGDYIRAGNCIYRFLAGGNIEAEYHEELHRLTIIDALTGIYNKRFLLEFLERELARSSRHRRALSLVIFDIDRFKAINDELGHLAGDNALRDLADCVRANLRREDLFARYGGEEFALVLAETTHQGATELAERIRKRVESHVFDYMGRHFKITISLGVASTSGGSNIEVNGLIREADDRLLQAKRSGRNRVEG